MLFRSAGGIGSNLLNILFDYGYNRKQFDYINTEIDIYDDDVVDLSNLLHQKFQIDDIGKAKVDVLADKYSVNGIKKLLTKEDLKDYDLVFCCVDNMVFRKDLYNYGWELEDQKPNEKKFFWIDGRCTSRQCALFTSSALRPSLTPYISDSKESGGCLLAFEKEQNISHTLPIKIGRAHV